MYLLLGILWFIWEAKYVLFWLFLWQLKDYHIGRFIDHFRTHKGQKIILNIELVLKLFLLGLFTVAPGFFTYLFSFLFLVYLTECVIFARAIIKKIIKKPVKTAKALFLSLLSFAVIILFLRYTLKAENSAQPLLFLVFDILTPVIVSVIVLFFQPIFVAIRKNTLRTAGVRMTQIKSVSGIKVIAITGSYGKTATKEFLATILSKRFRVLKTKEHQNSEIGVAKCILRELRPSHEIFIAEVGAYNKGKVKEVCDMIKPKIGIVTGVNEQHMALFGSLKNLLSAEGGGELLESLPKDGMVVVNGDNKYCLDLIKKSDRLPPSHEKVYAMSNESLGADIWADSVAVYRDSISFLAMDKTGHLANFKVKVLGKQNVQNLLGAILVAKELGMSFGQIAEACKGIFPAQAGMVLMQEKHGINVVDSSYSSNPDGVLADLDYLSVLGNPTPPRLRGAKKVIVMPCLIELGEKSGEIHETLGRKIGAVCDLAIITSKDKFAEINKGFSEVNRGGAKCLLCDKPNDIYAIITLFCKYGDAVLLEGRVPAELIRLLKNE